VSEKVVFDHSEANSNILREQITQMTTDWEAAKQRTARQQMLLCFLLYRSWV